MADDLIFLSGLWTQTSSRGQEFLSGSLGVGGKLLLFRNVRKRDERDPDYHLYLAPRNGQRAKSQASSSSEEASA